MSTHVVTEEVRNQIRAMTEAEIILFAKLMCNLAHMEAHLQEVIEHMLRIKRSVGDAKKVQLSSVYGEVYKQ